MADDAKGQLENLQTENNELVERVKELEMAKSTLADVRLSRVESSAVLVSGDYLGLRICGSRRYA